MLIRTTGFEELKKEVELINSEIKIEDIVKIDLPFIESGDDFSVVSIPSYGISEDDKKDNIIFVSGKKVIEFTSLKRNKVDKKFSNLEKRKNGECTISLFLLLKNYSGEFIKIREEMNRLDLNPIVDLIEETGRELRKLTDRLEGVMQIIIKLKENDIEFFNIELIDFDYDLLNAEARYWLERCRSHVYRISSLRTKAEMKSNMELNETMKKLTVIMTFLTIVSVVVNVPGTIGAIFGIPALSEAYFSAHTNLLIIALISTTLLSIILGYVYWKNLGLKSY